MDGWIYNYFNSNSLLRPMYCPPSPYPNYYKNLNEPSFGLTRIETFIQAHICQNLTWLLPLAGVAPPAGALISLRFPPSTICFLGVIVPFAKLLALPLLS